MPKAAARAPTKVPRSRPEPVVRQPVSEQRKILRTMSYEEGRDAVRPEPTVSAKPTAKNKLAGATPTALKDAPIEATKTNTSPQTKKAKSSIDPVSVAGDGLVGGAIDGLGGVAGGVTKGIVRTVVVDLVADNLESSGYTDEAGALRAINTLANPFASPDAVADATEAACDYSTKVHDAMIADIESDDSMFWSVVDTVGGGIAWPFEKVEELLTW